jgi:hypothetical protein
MRRVQRCGHLDVVKTCTVFYLCLNLAGILHSYTCTSAITLTNAGGSVSPATWFHAACALAWAPTIRESGLYLRLAPTLPCTCICFISAAGGGDEDPDEEHLASLGLQQNSNNEEPSYSNDSASRLLQVTGTSW